MKTSVVWIIRIYQVDYLWVRSQANVCLRGVCKLGTLIFFFFNISGLDIKHLVYMPVGHMVLKIYVSCKNFHVPSQYLYKPCKAYVYCWENKYMPRLKNHLPSRACNHKILCALGQDLLAPGMRARLNVEPCHFVLPLLLEKVREKVMEKSLNFILGFLYEPCSKFHNWPWKM